MDKSHKNPFKLLLCLAVGALIAFIAAVLIKYYHAANGDVKAD